MSNYFFNNGKSIQQVKEALLTLGFSKRKIKKLFPQSPAYQLKSYDCNIKFNWVKETNNAD